MQHHNSVFHGLLKYVPWDVFDRLVVAHSADRRVRHLTTKSQFVALLYGQLEGASSLREIEAGLGNHRRPPYHLGVAPPPPATLAEAHTPRPPAPLSEVVPGVASRAHPPPPPRSPR